jgi:hypothetical protein
MDVSRSGDPSSIPGRIWEWISVLMGKNFSLGEFFLKIENMKKVYGGRFTVDGSGFTVNGLR